MGIDLGDNEGYIRFHPKGARIINAHRPMLHRFGKKFPAYLGSRACQNKIHTLKELRFGNLNRDGFSLELYGSSHRAFACHRYESLYREIALHEDLDHLLTYCTGGA
jgi:hypothetical protein